jgi:hypothetical protein
VVYLIRIALEWDGTNQLFTTKLLSAAFSGDSIQIQSNETFNEMNETNGTNGMSGMS